VTGTYVRPGDINVTTFQLTSARGWTLDYMTSANSMFGDWNVYESVFQPYTTVDVNVIDVLDDMGTLMITGDEMLNISYTVPGITDPATWTFHLTEIADITHHGAMKSKSYQLRGTSPEMVNAQHLYVSKNWEANLTSEMVQWVVQNCFQSSKSWENPTPTTVPKKINGNFTHPMQFLDDLKERHVGPPGSSSAYTLFEQRTSTGGAFVFDTFDHLMSQGNSLGYTYTQDAGILGRDITARDDYRKILFLKVPRSFFVTSQWSAVSTRFTYNFATGKQLTTIVPYDPGKWTLSTAADEPVSSAEISDINATQSPPPRSTPIDPSNDVQATGEADAKIARDQFMSRLNNDIGMMEVYANPDLRVGNVITLNVPLKAAWAADGDTEKQINQDVLVVSIRHKARAPTMYPMCTYIVAFVKAGYNSSAG